MIKVVALVALLGLTINSGAIAADTKTSAASQTSTSSNAAATDSTAGITKHAKHPWHEPIAGRRAVLSLSSLTAKQKQQIKAVYMENKKQFESLQDQMRTLREAEWSRIKPLLTPDQLKELGKNHSEYHGKKVAAPAADAVNTEDASTAPTSK